MKGDTRLISSRVLDLHRELIWFLLMLSQGNHSTKMSTVPLPSSYWYPSSVLSHLRLFMTQTMFILVIVYFISGSNRCHERQKLPTLDHMTFRRRRFGSRFCVDCIYIALDGYSVLVECIEYSVLPLWFRLILLYMNVYFHILFTLVGWKLNVDMCTQSP